MLVGNWQQQCCGDAVGVGDVVTWRLRRGIERDHLLKTYGADQVARLTAVEERHDDVGPTDDVVQGRITGILSVTCRRRSDDGSHGVANYTVEVGGRIEPRERMIRTEREADGEQWAGYIVDIQPT